MDELEETVFYEGSPTTEAAPGEDDWFETAQMGRLDISENNDLGGEDDVEV